MRPQTRGLAEMGVGEQVVGAMGETGVVMVEKAEGRVGEAGEVMEVGEVRGMGEMEVGVVDVVC
jgi:hypothetical protein